MSTPPRRFPSFSSLIVGLAGLSIIVIALYQTFFTPDGQPNRDIIGALLALALGGGVGRVADNLVKGYVQAQIKAVSPPPPPTTEADDEAPA